MDASATPTTPAGTAHPIALKVMRLSRPTLATTKHPIISAPPTTASAAWIDSQTTYPQNVLAADTTPTATATPSAFLSLPDAFGNIYLGETFSAYLCVAPVRTAGNVPESLQPQSIAFRAELQTTTQRFALFDSSTVAASTVQPAAPTEFTVHHEIKELGTHILVCFVQYVLGGERKSFRKFYKFQVLNPLAVKTKMNSLPDGTTFLEALLQNTTTHPMVMEKMQLLPSDGYSCRDLNHGVFHDILAPQDIRQYLFLLKPTGTSAGPALGKLDLLWRTSFGEMGRLQTSTLQKKESLTGSSAETLTCTIVEQPMRIQPETSFPLTCRITNHSSTHPASLRLAANKAKMGTVLLVGAATRDLGVLQPGQSTQITLDFFPLTTGMQQVEGLTVTNVAGAGGSVELKAALKVG